MMLRQLTSAFAFATVIAMAPAAFAAEKAQDFFTKARSPPTRR